MKQNLGYRPFRFVRAMKLEQYHQLYLMLRPNLLNLMYQPRHLCLMYLRGLANLLVQFHLFLQR